MSILNFIKGMGVIDFAFIGLFIILIIAFLREFKITSKQSWIVLIGLTSLGALFTFQSWRKRKLLQEFEAREKALNNLEKEYEQLKNRAKISEEAYLKAKEELARARYEAGIAIMRANEKLAKDLQKIESEYQNIPIEESIQKIKEALGSK